MLNCSRFFVSLRMLIIAFTVLFLCCQKNVSRSNAEPEPDPIINQPELPVDSSTNINPPITDSTSNDSTNTNNPLPDTVRPEPPRQDTVKPEPPTPDTTKPDPPKPDTVKPQPPKPDTVKPNPPTPPNPPPPPPPPPPPVVALREYFIAPKTTDPNITTCLSNHFASVKEGAVLKNVLYVFLPGTSRNPTGCKATTQKAASLGFHTIGLMYDNLVAGNTLCKALDDVTCHRRARLEVIDGVDRHPSVNVNSSNSLVNRLYKLLVYLNSQHPSQNWGQYIVNGKPDWSRSSSADILREDVLQVL